METIYSNRQMDIFHDYLNEEPLVDPGTNSSEQENLNYISTANQDHTISELVSGGSRYEDNLELAKQRLHSQLATLTGRRILLSITNNTRTMVTMRVDTNTGMVYLRLHRMFLLSPPKIQRIIAHTIQHPRSNRFSKELRDFIDSKSHTIVYQSPKLSTHGKVYNLSLIFDELNQNYFNTSLSVGITWGRGTSGAIRSIRFGSYYDKLKLIRIHPRLDQSFVPPFVIQHVVHHEMVHAFLGSILGKGGRRLIHSEEFKEMERTYSFYAEAVAWLSDKENLKRLLKPPVSKS